MELLKGVYSSLITPFFKDKIDYDSLKKLINHQLNGGIHGLVILDDVSEESSLNIDERKELIENIFKYVDGKTNIFIGICTNSTNIALKLIDDAEKFNSSGYLVVTPYYNIPTQEGLYLHFETLAKHTERPICLYSSETRCGVELSFDTVMKLHKNYKQIIGIKESGGSCNRVSRLIKDNCKNFNVLAGNDALALPFFALGAHGIISVAANWITEDIVKLFNFTSLNDFENAANINKKYYPMFRAITIEPSPVSIKYILHKAGLIKSPEVRLPLCDLSSKTSVVIDKILKQLN